MVCTEGMKRYGWGLGYCVDEAKKRHDRRMLGKRKIGVIYYPTQVKVIYDCHEREEKW